MVTVTEAELRALQDDRGPELARKFMGEVPLRFKSASLTAIDDDDLRATLENWTGDRMPLLYSPGPGTGKTWAAVAFARHVAETRGVSFKYVSAAGMFARMRLAFDGGPKYEPPINRPLLLDDLGKQRTSEWVQEWFFIILDQMWANQLPLIVTTNTSQRELLAQLGEPSMDRLRDMVSPVRLHGESRRGRSS